MSVSPEPLRFIAKQELARIPIFGWAARRMGHVFIDRRDSHGAAKAIADRIARGLSGVGLFFFAEGTRSTTEQLLPFKKGFAHFAIDYVPEAAILESKSLKLYLGAFRNHAAFHEDCALAIARRLVETLAPRWLRIGGYWYPRGGIPIDVFYQTGPRPDGLWLPDPGVAPYRGRG